MNYFPDGTILTRTSPYHFATGGILPQEQLILILSETSEYVIVQFVAGGAVDIVKLCRVTRQGWKNMGWKAL